MDKEFVCKKIEMVLSERMNIDSNLFTHENRDVPLTGRVFNFDGINMVYLLYEIERAFEIKIPYQWFKNYGFININAISDVVCNIKEV